MALFLFYKVAKEFSKNLTFHLQISLLELRILKEKIVLKI